jgi:hypothetical protein
MGKMSDIKRNHWSAEDLGEQSSYEDETEIKRRLARGNETIGNADERDVAGSVPVEDTPEGREDRGPFGTVVENASQGEPPEKPDAAKVDQHQDEAERTGQASGEDTNFTGGET